jgi:hypothetical protein
MKNEKEKRIKEIKIWRKRAQKEKRKAQDMVKPVNQLSKSTFLSYPKFPP